MESTRCYHLVAFPDFRSMSILSSFEAQTTLETTRRSPFTPETDIFRSCVICSTVTRSKKVKLDFSLCHQMQDCYTEINSGHFITLQSQKRASCSKSAITKPISGCVRIACFSLMITSLLQVVYRLTASCELHADLFHQLAASLQISRCSKSVVHRLDAT